MTTGSDGYIICKLKLKYRGALNGRFKSTTSNGRGTSSTKAWRRRQRYLYGSAKAK